MKRSRGARVSRAKARVATAASVAAFLVAGIGAPVAMAQKIPPGVVVMPGGPDGQPPGAPGQPPGSQPPKGEQPATTQAVIIVPASTQPVDDTKATVTLNFKDASIDAVLDYLVEKTGYTLIKEGAVDGRVTIETRRPVRPSEAVALLNTLLRIQGYALVQQDHELRVMPRGKAKKADVPVRFGADPEQVPLSDEVITQVIPLGRSDAVRLKTDLQPLVGPDADFTANHDNNSLVLTDIARNVKRIVKIVAELDRQGTTSSEMRIIRLKHADAETTAKLIASVFKGAGGDGGGGVDPRMMQMIQQGQMSPDALGNALRGGRSVSATPDARTGTIVVTGPPDSLKLVDKVVESLEADETTPSEVRIFTLKYADADLAAKLVTDMFKTEDPNAGFPFRFIFFGGPPQDNAKTSKVNATADYRTGTLIVTAAPLQMKIVAEVLERIDANPATESSFFIYRLKNAQAPKLQLVLNTLFGVGPEGGGNQAQQFQQQQQNGQPNGLQNQQSFGGRSNSRGSRSSNQGGGTGIGQRRGGRNGTPQQGMPQLSSNAQHMIGEMAGEVFVVADEDTNSLLVTTASKYREQVRQIIEELDRPVPQVLIKVLVAEVTHDNSEDLGVDFSILNQRVNSNGTVTGGVKGGTSFGTATATGGLVVSLLESNVQATLRALQTQGKLDVLSRPYILASDNQLATITVGQEVPFITDTRVTELGQQLNTIEYQDVGIILNVTPHINPEGLVILDVTPEISELTSSTVPIGPGVAAPIISKRSADSRVGIIDGQTIVIGGLMEDRKISDLQKVPILGDLPLLGPIFQRNNVSKRKTELLIFLTPHVAQQPGTLRPMSQDELRGTKLTPNAVEPGTFDDHLRGMQRGGSGGGAPSLPAQVPTTVPTSQPSGEP